MKRRAFGGAGGGRWRRDGAAANMDEPLPKKHEVDEEFSDEGANEDPMPAVFSLLNQQQGGANMATRAKGEQLLQMVNMKGAAGEREPRDKLFNSQLVQEISRHPALFDFTTEEYKSIEARNKHWEEVSSRVGQHLEFVRTRWKTLRDRFKKEVRRVQANQPGLPWQHYEEMLYLLPFVRDKLEEVAYCAGGSLAVEGRGRHQKHQNSGRANNAQKQADHVAAQQQQMNSCTAAILDLAMNAVNKFSPPTTPPSCESAATDHFNGELAGAGASSGNTCWTTAITDSSNSRLRTFPEAQQNESRATRRKFNSSKGNSSNGNSSKRHLVEKNGGQQIVQPQSKAGWMGMGRGVETTEGGDEEDQLFCRIVLKKLGKLEERVKERAKAKIMEMLVELQYGEGVDKKC